jgi:hypothetical protein
VTLLRTTIAVVLAALMTIGCVTLHRPVEVDPDATFAAHQEHAGLAIDRFERGRSGRLGPAAVLRLPGTPTFVLEVEGEKVAFVWLAGSEAVVRRTPADTSPLVGTVTPGWDENAIRLTLRPADGTALKTDVFAHKSSGAGPEALARTAQTVLDVRGTWEASVRDSKGAAVGWMRVRIGPYLPAPRIFEAMLPSGLPPELVTAAAAALGAEIDWIEDHAQNVYRGSGGSGPLERSVPMSR